MEFRWNRWNEEHIGRHGVLPEEAKAAIENARPPFPLAREDDTVYVIHARPLTEKEKRRLRRRSK